MKKQINIAADKMQNMRSFVVIKNEEEESIAMSIIMEMRDDVEHIAANIPAYGTKEYDTAKLVIAKFNGIVDAINFGNFCNPTRETITNKIYPTA